MARIRTIKPHFFRSYDVAALSYRARLTWIGLWTYVDDEGRGRDDARIIKGELWALEDDVTWKDVQRDLTELSRSAHVVRYTSDGRDYLCIPTWLDHQVISRPTKSRFPPMSPANIRDEEAITEHSLSTHGVLPAGKGTGNREMEVEREQGKPSLTAEFDTAWAHWPKKVERKKAFERFKIAAPKHPQLVADIIRFGDSYAATTEKQFVPALGVWLSGERWTDELPQSRQTKPTKDERALSLIEQGRAMDEAQSRKEISA